MENTAYRYKALIGSVIRSRTLQGQRVEARVGCKILEANRPCWSERSVWMDT